MRRSLAPAALQPQARPDRQGRLPLGTGDAGVLALEGERIEPLVHAPELPSDLVTAFATDPSGALWIGTSGGLARFTGESVERLAG